MVPVSNEVLSQFSVALDSGEALLHPNFCSDLIRIALLHNREYNAVSVARINHLTARTVNRYQTMESMPNLQTAVSILDTLGYDVVLRKR